jgi:hypothetical protein
MPAQTLKVAAKVKKTSGVKKPRLVDLPLECFELNGKKYNIKDSILAKMPCGAKPATFYVRYASGKCGVVKGPLIYKNEIPLDEQIGFEQLKSVIAPQLLPMNVHRVIGQDNYAYMICSDREGVLSNGKESVSTMTRGTKVLSPVTYYSPKDNGSCPAEDFLKEIYKKGKNHWAIHYARILECMKIVVVKALTANSDLHFGNVWYHRESGDLVSIDDMKMMNDKHIIRSESDSVTFLSFMFLRRSEFCYSEMLLDCLRVHKDEFRVWMNSCLDHVKGVHMTTLLATEQFGKLFTLLNKRFRRDRKVKISKTESKVVKSRVLTQETFRTFMIGRMVKMIVLFDKEMS